MSCEVILFNTDGPVGVVTMNRPGFHERVRQKSSVRVAHEYKLERHSAHNGHIFGCGPNSTAINAANKGEGT